jgi:hypothetical protein
MGGILSLLTYLCAVLKEIEQDMTVERRRVKQARRRKERSEAEAEKTAATSHANHSAGEEDPNTVQSRRRPTFY